MIKLVPLATLLTAVIRLRLRNTPFVDGQDQDQLDLGLDHDVKIQLLTSMG